MVALLLEEKCSSQGTQQTQDEEARQNIGARREIILEYLKSIGERKDTSPEEKMKEMFYTWSLAYTTGSTFHYLVILPDHRAWEPSPEIPWYLEQAEEEAEEDEKEELKFLHDYVVNDLSVEYHASKELDEEITSLRKQYGFKGS